MPTDWSKITNILKNKRKFYRRPTFTFTPNNQCTVLKTTTPPGLYPSDSPPHVASTPPIPQAPPCWVKPPQLHLKMIYCLDGVDQHPCHPSSPLPKEPKGPNRNPLPKHNPSITPSHLKLTKLAKTKMIIRWSLDDHWMMSPLDLPSNMLRLCQLSDPPCETKWWWAAISV